MYRRSLVRPPFAQDCSRPRKRPARTPPSTFLFLLIHLSNNPGSLRNPGPRERSESHRNPRIRQVSDTCSPSVSEELRRRAIAPRRRRAERSVYRVTLSRLSTLEVRKIDYLRHSDFPANLQKIDVFRIPPAAPHAVLQPHSSAVLCSSRRALLRGGDPRIAHRAIWPVNISAVRTIDGHGFGRHRA